MCYLGGMVPYMQMDEALGLGNFRVEVVRSVGCDEMIRLRIVGLSGKVRYNVRDYTPNELMRLFDEDGAPMYVDTSWWIKGHLMRHAKMAWPSN